MTNTKAWTRSYRPSSIAELRTTTVVRSLSEFVTQNRVPQALLFSGPKGTGKTSTARIIAAMLNQAGAENGAALRDADPTDPITKAIVSGSSHYVSEMDAASNRGIDDIRQLKERVYLPPQFSNTAVYILDEVHMLTSEAFNALLKLLEEPPSHAVFILATTELHKIPATVVSRCQLVRFQKATHEQLVRALEHIATTEQIQIESDALALIADRADGSFRDAIKLLESIARPQLAQQTPGVTTGADQITASAVQTRLGMISPTQITELVSALLAKDAAAISGLFQTYRDEHIDPEYLYTSLISFLHQQLVAHSSSHQTELTRTTRVPKLTPEVAHYVLLHLTQPNVVIPSPIAGLSLELALLDLVFKSKAKAARQETKTSDANSDANIDSSPPEAASARAQDTKPRSEPSPKSPGSSAAKTKQQTAYLCDHWREFIAQVGEVNQSVAALLRGARAIAHGESRLEIQVYYRFHHEQLHQPKFFQIVSQVARELLGTEIEIVIHLVSADAIQQDRDDTTSGSPDPDHTPEHVSLTQLASEALL
jgi:DNA polymerase-3 subunit gamma/tau